MTAYYNEIDPFAAQWLHNLIDAGHIAPGDVDTRSITEVQPDDIKNYTQVHLFAGLGGWSLALRLAGWPDDRPVWTGSCPCQPFSSAGKQKGHADERHLWPEMFRLVRECQPSVVFGEQVSSAIGHGWLDGVFGDLEGAGYETGAAVLPACFVGAPHMRARLYFVATVDKCGVLCDKLQIRLTERISLAYEKAMQQVSENASNRGVWHRVAISRQASLFMPNVRSEPTPSIPPEQQREKKRGGEGTEQSQSEYTTGIQPNLPAKICLANDVDARQKESSQTGAAIRLGQPCCGNSTKSGCDAVRDDGDSSSKQFGLWGAGEEALQHDISGQNCARDGLRLQQRADSLLADKRRNGDVGGKDAAAGPNGVDNKEPINAGNGIQLQTHDQKNTSGQGNTNDFSVGAPHKRFRLYWVADAASIRSGERQQDHGGGASRSVSQQGPVVVVRRDGDPLGDAGCGGRRAQGHASEPTSGVDWAGAVGAWSDFTVVHCLDGKARRVGRGVSPLVDGVPRELGRGQPELFRLARRARANRVGRLKGYGNAITAQVAAEFIRAVMEARP